MKQTIKKPYSVNNIFYVSLLALSLMGIVYFCGQFDSLNPTIQEVMKNISYGCFASVLVAWLIEIANIRDKNRKAEELYINLYKDLYVAIYRYISVWADICLVYPYNDGKGFFLL